MRYFFNVLVALDQLINTLLFGDEDETISSRAWRCKGESAFWRRAYKFIDFIFSPIEDNHCETAYLNEVKKGAINGND